MLPVKNTTTFQEIVANLKARKGNRVEHLAYGLLTGWDISNLESPASNPHAFPLEEVLWKLDVVLIEARHEDRLVFISAMRESLTAWHKNLYLSWMAAEPLKRQRNADKRAARLVAV